VIKIIRSSIGQLSVTADFFFVGVQHIFCQMCCGRWQWRYCLPPSASGLTGTALTSRKRQCSVPDTSKAGKIRVGAIPADLFSVNARADGYRLASCTVATVALKLRNLESTSAFPIICHGSDITLPVCIIKNISFLRVLVYTAHQRHLRRCAV